MAGDPFIPEDWCKSVCKILLGGDDSKIDWTKSAFDTWQAATLSAFRYEPQEAMASALSTPGITGKKISLPESGDTYAFWFTFKRIKLYGKICLRPEGLKIKIISAHTPRKGDILS